MFSLKTSKAKTYLEHVQILCEYNYSPLKTPYKLV